MVWGIGRNRDPYAASANPRPHLGPPHCRLARSVIHFSRAPDPPSTGGGGFVWEGTASKVHGGAGGTGCLSGAVAV